jgi:repressor LexA
MKPLTNKQKQVLDFIEIDIEKNQVSPTYREIGVHFKFSSLGTVYSYIQQLIEKGHLLSRPGTSRALQPHKIEEKIPFVPLIGTLRAGMPIETFSCYEMLPTSLRLPDGEEAYFLRIQGTSLMEDQIQDGDLLLVSPCTTVLHGKMMIALVNHYTTLVKKIFFDPPYIRFESLNPEVQPLILRKDDVEIQAKVISLIRDY